MRVFKKLTVKGIPFFENETIDLETPGLTVITGLNLEGVSKSNKGSLVNSNFCGKTLLFSSLKDLFFNDGASGNSKDKLSRGEIILEMSVGRSELTLRRYAKGSSMRYEIIQDGKNVTPDGVLAQKALLTKILGHDQNSFEVTYYLDHLRPHYLRTGDTAQRRDFFTKFFKLTAADIGKKVVDRARLSLKRDTALLVELREQKAGLTLVDPTPLRGMLRKATTFADQWTALADDLRMDRAHVQFRQRHAKVLDILWKTNHEKAEDALLAAEENLDKRVASAREVVKRFNEFATYRAELQANEKAWKRRQEYIDGNQVKDEWLVPGYYENFTARYNKLERAYNDAYDKFNEMRRSRQKSTDEKAAIKKSMEDALLEMELFQQGVRAGTCACPTCGQEVKDQSRVNAQKSLQAKYKEILARFQALGEDFSSEDLKAAHAEYQRLEKIMERAKTQRWILRDIPPAPDDPEKPAGTCPSEDVYQRAADYIQSALDIREALEEIGEEGNLLYLQDYLDGTERTYSDEELDKATDAERTSRVKAASLEARLNAAEEAAANYQQLEDRIKDLEEVVKDTDCLDVLHRAFSSTDGIKSMQIKSLCSMLEGQINKLSRHIFPNEYTFRFELETQFSIMVTRRVGDHNETTDVRKLSGAEAGLFDLMLSLALQTFLPERLRCNLLIMDELDANFGPAMSQAFVNFLPKLLGVVPHVIVLTPLETDYGEDARYFTVVHKGGRSKLLRGKRTHIRELAVAAAARKKAK